MLLGVALLALPVHLLYFCVDCLIPGAALYSIYTVIEAHVRNRTSPYKARIALVSDIRPLWPFKALYQAGLVTAKFGGLIVGMALYPAALYADLWYCSKYSKAVLSRLRGYPTPL